MKWSTIISPCGSTRTCRSHTPLWPVLLRTYKFKIWIHNKFLAPLPGTWVDFSHLCYLLSNWWLSLFEKKKDKKKIIYEKTTKIFLCIIHLSTFLFFVFCRWWRRTSGRVHSSLGERDINLELLVTTLLWIFVWRLVRACVWMYVYMPCWELRVEAHFVQVAYSNLVCFLCLALTHTHLTHT